MTTQNKGIVSWFSNSPTAPTGYGVQTKQVVDRLIRDGFDLAILSNYGREGVNGFYESPFGKVPEYSRGAEMYSQDVTPLNHSHHVAMTRKKKGALPDLLVTLYDVWVMKGAKYDALNIASWTPVDHVPIPPKVREWLEKPNVTPLAMAKFGQEQMAAFGIESIYIPHAIEKVFTNTPEIEGLPGREYMGIDDSRFVVGMNFANKAAGPLHRKAVAEAFLAFSIFAKNHDDALLYLHTDMFGVYGGWKLGDLLEAVGLTNDQVLFCDQIAYRYGISQETLAGLYSQMDVLLAPSYGEGFGVPVIEAQATGTPVIVSDVAASPELVGDGFAVPCQPFWDEAQKSWFNVPNVGALVSALEEQYAKGRYRSEKAIEYVQQYDAEHVYQTHWLPALDKLLK